MQSIYGGKPWRKPHWKNPDLEANKALKAQHTNQVYANLVTIQIYVEWFWEYDTLSFITHGFQNKVNCFNIYVV